MVLLQPSINSDYKFNLYPLHIKQKCVILITFKTGHSAETANLFNSLYELQLTVNKIQSQIYMLIVSQHASTEIIHNIIKNIKHYKVIEREINV